MEVLEIDAERDERLHDALSHFWTRALRSVDANQAFDNFAEGFVQRLGAHAAGVEPHEALIDIPDPRTERSEKYAMVVRAHNGEPKPIEELSPIWKGLTQLFRMHARKIRVFVSRRMLESAKPKVVRDALESALADVPETYRKAID